MLQPNDVMNALDENWEEFKKQAAQDPLYYNGPGDLLDTPEGRAKFCRLNETAVFRMTIKKRSRVDPALMEDIDYDENGMETGKSYEPA